MHYYIHIFNNMRNYKVRHSVYPYELKKKKSINKFILKCVGIFPNIIFYIFSPLKLYSFYSDT